MRPSDLNFQHLRYFHAVAHEGTVLRAARELHLAPSTVSGQIKVLEAQLGQALFTRVGRNLALTPFGERVLTYADEIFDLGASLVHTATRGDVRRPVRVGVSSVIPKLLVREILRDAAAPDVQLQVEQGPAEELLGALAARRLDVVLSDAELPTWMGMRATNHQIVETGIALFGTPDLVAQVGQRIPHGLSEVPWLVPPPGTSMRLGLEGWWETEGIHPDIAAVIDDSALLKALGDAGVGIFAAPERMIDAILESYRVQCLGVTQEVRERTYAITREADPEEPTVRRICGLDAGSHEAIKAS